MRNAITWVDETDITDRLIGQGEVTSGMIQRMAAYLARKRGERAIASRADIDPTEIREFLPYVVLVDIESDPAARLLSPGRHPHRRVLWRVHRHLDA